MTKTVVLQVSGSSSAAGSYASESYTRASFERNSILTVIKNIFRNFEEETMSLFLFFFFHSLASQTMKYFPAYFH